MKALIIGNGYYQMRAVICKVFPGYTFEALDRLPLERVMEIYASAEWLAEEEKGWLERKVRRR